MKKFLKKRLDSNTIYMPSYFSITVGVKRCFKMIMSNKILNKKIYCRNFVIADAPQ